MLGLSILVVGILLLWITQRMRQLTDRLSALEDAIGAYSRRLLASDGEVARLRQLVNAETDSPAPSPVDRSVTAPPEPAPPPVVAAPPKAPVPPVARPPVKPIASPARPAADQRFRRLRRPGVGVGRGRSGVAFRRQHGCSSWSDRPPRWRGLLPQPRGGIEAGCRSSSD